MLQTVQLAQYKGLDLSAVVDDAVSDGWVAPAARLEPEFDYPYLDRQIVSVVVNGVGGKEMWVALRGAILFSGAPLLQTVAIPALPKRYLHELTWEVQW